MNEGAAADLVITGGASPEIAAAIVAVVGHLLETEARARSQPPQRYRQHQWVLSGRPSIPAASLPSHTYDTAGWTDTSDNGEDT